MVCVKIHTNYTNLSNYTEDVKLLHSKVPIFRVKSGKNYTGQIFFTQAPLVVLVTNMRYEIDRYLFQDYFTHMLLMTFIIIIIIIIIIIDR